MTKADERIGRNLQELRGSMSQAALASLMKDRGWKWSQPTVAAVEKGERPLKLAEAEHLVVILGLTDIEELTVRPLRTLADNVHDRVVRSADELRLAAVEFWEAQREMARIAESLGDEATEVDRKIWATWLASEAGDPLRIIETVAPQAPLYREAFEAVPELGKSMPWARALAFGPYGVHSRRYPRRESEDGAPADPAE